MRQGLKSWPVVAFTMLLGAQISSAQIARTRAPNGEAPAAAASGIPRDARFPYAGLWRGTRIMPVGSDEVVLQFTNTDGTYSGAMIHPGGGRAPANSLSATASGLTWESPNSGGGMWVYHVRLVSPDSIEGTLVLRDAPPQFNPVPKGTMALTRQKPDARRDK